MEELDILKAQITINEMCIRIGNAKSKATGENKTILKNDFKNILEAQIVFRCMEKEMKIHRSRCYDLENINLNLKGENLELEAANKGLINGL